MDFLHLLINGLKRNEFSFHHNIFFHFEFFYLPNCDFCYFPTFCSNYLTSSFIYFINHFLLCFLNVLFQNNVSLNLVEKESSLPCPKCSQQSNKYFSTTGHLSQQKLKKIYFVKVPRLTNGKS